MKEKYIQIFGIVVTVAYAFIVAWFYWVAPKNLGEVTSKAKQTIETATTKTQVAIGVYEVDKLKFREGLRAFHQDRFIVALDNFEKADKESRDATTQFYIAYTYYRQGWGRISNDDELFKKGLEKVKRVIQIDDDFKSADVDLKMKTPVELKHELEEGLRITANDFNPLRLTRQRK